MFAALLLLLFLPGKNRTSNCISSFFHTSQLSSVPPSFSLRSIHISSLKLLPRTIGTSGGNFEFSSLSSRHFFVYSSFLYIYLGFERKINGVSAKFFEFVPFNGNDRSESINFLFFEKKKGGKNLENWKKCLLGSRLTLRRLSARNVFG